MPEPRRNWYAVPAGTPPSTCRGHERGGTCRATVYWIEYTRKDKRTGTRTVRQPVDCAGPDGWAPSSKSDGWGVSHYLTCPDVGSFSHGSQAEEKRR